MLSEPVLSNRESSLGQFIFTSVKCIGSNKTLFIRNWSSGNNVYRNSSLPSKNHASLAQKLSSIDRCDLPMKCSQWSSKGPPIPDVSCRYPGRFSNSSRGIASSSHLRDVSKSIRMALEPLMRKLNRLISPCLIPSYAAETTLSGRLLGPQCPHAVHFWLVLSRLRWRGRLQPSGPEISAQYRDHRSTGTPLSHSPGIESPSKNGRI